jgi:hypothetical protein
VGSADLKKKWGGRDAKTSGETAPARSRGEGSEGPFTAQRAMAISVMMKRARANQAAILACPLGSSLYPLGLALSITPCGARCRTKLNSQGLDHRGQEGRGAAGCT